MHSCSVDPYCTDIISSCPKIPISEFVFQVGVSLEDHHRTLPFQVSHELRDAIFGRYTYQKVHMIWYHVSLYDFHSFPFTQILDYVSDIRSELVVYYFPAVFGRKHDMILAHPFRSVYKELHADRETGC